MRRGHGKCISNDSMYRVVVGCCLRSHVPCGYVEAEGAQMEGLGRHPQKGGMEMTLGLVLIVLMAVVFWFITKWWYRIWFGVIERRARKERKKWQI